MLTKNAQEVNTENALLLPDLDFQHGGALVQR